MKIKNVKGDMWDQFQKYLNDGEYEKAEAQRIDKKNEKYPVSGEQISLADYVGADRSLENRSVSFYSGPNAFEVDKKKFLEVADTIMLNKIETTEAVIENWHGIYISAAESNNFAFISSDGKVSRNNPTHSILLPAEYIIKGEDIAKLYTLFPEESKQNISPLNRAYIKYEICGAGFLAVICAVFVLIIRRKNRQ